MEELKSEKIADCIFEREHVDNLKDRKKKSLKVQHNICLRI